MPSWKNSDEEKRRAIVAKKKSQMSFTPPENKGHEKNKSVRRGCTYNSMSAEPGGCSLKKQPMMLYGVASCSGGEATDRVENSWQHAKGRGGMPKLWDRTHASRPSQRVVNILFFFLLHLPPFSLSWFFFSFLYFFVSSSRISQLHLIPHRGFHRPIWPDPFPRFSSASRSRALVQSEGEVIFLLFLPPSWSVHIRPVFAFSLGF